MGEVKSVKVDNWGVFFLQKLQNFFNKTDYCDLTLQFNDNSQLKVHRLVLSACTDYFNVLEQTCEVLDDTLVMPRGLQADVVVPIVNFMYTGTLEFEISMYGRLLKTARDMNMTVLLKLLEAHKRTVENSRPQLLAKRAQPAKTFINRRVPSSQAMPIKVEQIYNQPSTSGTRRIPVSSHQYKTLQIKPVAPSTSYYPQIRASEQTSSIVTKYAHSKTPVKGPSRFDCNDDTVLPPDSFEQFDAISYESKPLITANQICKEDLEDYDNLIPAHDTSATFEQLRKSYTNNKRPSSSVSSFESPPEKKPNIQDVKEYAEQQLMRKQIAAEYDDDNEFEDILDDEFHNDDDDEDYVPPASIQKQNKKSAIVIKQDRDQKPTIVVKDTAGSNVNHAKIISEVLKKYPHLVKNNKNIKLKIMAKSSTSPNQNIIIKQESDSEQYGTHSQEIPKSITLNIPKSVTVQNTVSSKSAVQKASISHPAPVKSQAPLSSAPGSKAPIPGTTPRRIDSKTMHALIAKGAENTTGPWLCLRCGINGRPISIPSYRGFRRHLINIHKEKVDPRLCEHCGWRSQNNVELYHHLKVQHDINPPFGFNYPKCEYCSTILLNKTNLALHMKTEHPDKISKQQQCMYCNGMFQDEDVLYNHMHSRHKLRAQKDGLIDYTDDEDDASFYCENPADNKIKILSNITLPQGNIKPGAKISLEQSAGASGLSTVATGIAASLGLIDSSDSQEIQYLEETGFINAGSTTEPKFVNADGHLMELTPEQREEIISQLDNQHEGGVVMLLSQEPFEVKAEQIVSAESGTADSNTAENKEESSEAEVGVFSEDPKPDKTKIEIKENDSELDESMEWQIDTQSTTESSKEAKSKDDDDAEKEDSEQKDAGEEDNSQVIDESIEENDSKNGEKTEEEKNKIKSAKESLKLLTGDWSDDEEEADDETVAPELEEKQQSEEKEDDIPASKENDDTIESKNNAADSTATIENTEIPENEIIYETVTSIDASSYVEQDKEDKELEEEEESKKSECIEKQLTDEEQSEDKSMDVEDDVKGDEEVDTKAVDGVKIKEEHTKSEIEEIVKENEKNRKKSISKNESGDEKDEEEEKSDGKIKTDSTQKESGGDPIRSLISDWGDDDDDDDDEEL